MLVNWRKSVAVFAGIGLVTAVVVTLWLIAQTSPLAAPGAPSADTQAPSASERSARLTRYVQAATVIVHGRITSVRDITEEVKGKMRDYHVAHLEPLRIFKGAAGSSGTIEVRDLGHRGANRIGGYSDEVTFHEGSEVILFLELLGPDPEKPYLTPVGLRRGMFTVVTTPDMGRVVLDGEEFTAWTEKMVLPSVASGYPLQVGAFLEQVELRGR